MKVRKLAVALALAGGLSSGVAQALGLGEIELQSYLNEPLDADISLRKSEGVSPGDVFVNIAPDSAFERVGIDKSYFLTKLNFQVTTAPNGSLVVNVSTREPLREPYLNFLVEVTWPNGRLMREYAVLVDPPVYAEESGVQEQVSVPASGQRSQPQQQARPAAPAQTTRNARQERSPGERSLGPTNSADTLWTIASQVRPSNDVTMQQMMLAIQDLNPGAFIDDNINLLKRGEILRIPDENQIRSRSRAQANQEVAAQSRALSAPNRTVDATDQTANAPEGEVSGAGGGDQLRLMAADDTASRDAADGGSAGGDGDTAGGVDAGSAVAKEELESARRENDELTGRVDDLQGQVETLQRLLELKNTQLADMQNTQGESSEDIAMAGDDPAQSATEFGEPADPADPAIAESAADQQDMAADQTDETGDQPSAEEMSDAGAPVTAEEQGESVADQEAAAAPAEPEATAKPEAEAAPASAPAPTDTAPTQKPFPGNIIDAITNNFIYQVALGAGLVVLLLLLLLLARRNANREQAFYDQLNNEEPGDESDAFDLTFDEDVDAEAPESDAIAEADAYIAYGRNDQAAHALEAAISREPSRSDLRLKLLGVYAEIQDRESFDKQFREIEALDDEAATAEAKSLQSGLDEAESMPSIDDLESQLRSGGSDQEERVSYESDYDLEAYEEPETEDSEDDRDGLIEYELSDMETGEESASDSAELDETETSDESKKSDDLDEPFDFSLDEDDLPQSDKPDPLSGESEADEDDDLSLDFDTSEMEVDDELESSADAEKNEAKPATGETEDLEIDGDGELDESFLDELDAELDKVAVEDETSEQDDKAELDDLELDVSDEDLALMEEFSESDDKTPSEALESAEDDELSLDDELGLEDTLNGEATSNGEETSGKDDEPSDSGSDEVAPPVASNTASARDSDRDIDEADLGDDDDFDFLSGTDEAATKLDLARAYVEMGDADGARDILEEVALEGNDEQKAEAQDLLKNLS